MPYKCWVTAYDAGSTSNQHWMTALCFLGWWRCRSIMNCQSSGRSRPLANDAHIKCEWPADAANVGQLSSDHRSHSVNIMITSTVRIGGCRDLTTSTGFYFLALLVCISPQVTALSVINRDSNRLMQPDGSQKNHRKYNNCHARLVRAYSGYFFKQRFLL